MHSRTNWCITVPGAHVKDEEGERRGWPRWKVQRSCPLPPPPMASTPECPPRCGGQTKDEGVSEQCGVCVFWGEGRFLIPGVGIHYFTFLRGTSLEAASGRLVCRLGCLQFGITFQLVNVDEKGKIFLYISFLLKSSEIYWFSITQVSTQCANTSTMKINHMYLCE